MAASGTPGNVTLGPGRLYVAPIGTADPTDNSTALPSAWIPVGYTEEGTEISTSITSEGIEVAEEMDPIAYVQTSRKTTVGFAMAEATAKRLKLAIGAGVSATDDASPFEFPNADEVVAVKLCWDSNETAGPTNRRWLFRSCTPSGTVSITRRKAPAKSTIPVVFDCAKPSTGLKPLKVFPNASGQI